MNAGSGRRDFSPRGALAPQNRSRTARLKPGADLKSAVHRKCNDSKAELKLRPGQRRRFVAHALLRAVSRLISTPGRAGYQVSRSTFATAFTVRRTSSSLVCQLQTLTRMARMPRQVVPVKNASPVLAIAAITLVGSPVVAEADQPLIDRRPPQHLRSRQTSDPFDQCAGVIATPLNQRGDSVAP